MIVRYDFSRTCFPSQWLNSEYSELSFECDECIASFSLLPRRASNFQSVGNSSSANSLAFSWLLTGLLMKTLHKQRQQKYTKIQVWDQNKDALFHVLFLHLAWQTLYCNMADASSTTKPGHLQTVPHNNYLFYPIWSNMFTYMLFDYIWFVLIFSFRIFRDLTTAKSDGRNWGTLIGTEQVHGPWPESACTMPPQSLQKTVEAEREFRAIPKNRDVTCPELASRPGHLFEGWRWDFLAIQNRWSWAERPAGGAWLKYWTKKLQSALQHDATTINVYE